MTTKVETATNISQVDLDRTGGSRPVGSGSGSSSVSASSSQAGDSIALSQTSDLVQLALSAGAATRSARTEQLKNLVETNQYNVDASSVSNALIDAHLAGD